MSLIPPNISLENLNLGEFDVTLPTRIPVMTVKEWLRREKRLEQWRRFSADNVDTKVDSGLRIYPTKEGLEEMQQKYSELQEYLNEVQPPTHGLAFEIIDGKCVSRQVNLDKLGNVFKKFRK